MDEPLTTQQIARSVLAVLAGVPIPKAAARIRMEATDLAAAVAVYQAAGYAALQIHDATRSWHQVWIQFTDWNAAEHIAATYLGPQLQRLEDAGVLMTWWFLRKAPCWRLRCQPCSATTASDLQVAMGTVLDNLTEADLIDRWSETVYEPELCAFGGPRGMDIAHALFHADSHSVLDYLRHYPTTPPQGSLGRRELSVLLCSILVRSAGQDWHEHGDVWHRVTQLRPLPPDTLTDRLPGLTSGLRQLMTVSTDSRGALFGTGGPLEFAAPWAAAFDQAGRCLGNAAHNGTLHRGLRDVLAHHVIFHWNRLGLAARAQAILARAARDTVMNPANSLPGARPADGGH